MVPARGLKPDDVGGGDLEGFGEFVDSLQGGHAVAALNLCVIVRVQSGHFSNLALSIALLFADARKVCGNLLKKIGITHTIMISPCY